MEKYRSGMEKVFYVNMLDRHFWPLPSSLAHFSVLCELAHKVHWKKKTDVPVISISLQLCTADTQNNNTIVSMIMLNVNKKVKF